MILLQSEGLGKRALGIVKCFYDRLSQPIGVGWFVVSLLAFQFVAVGFRGPLMLVKFFSRNSIFERNLWLRQVAIAGGSFKVGGGLFYKRRLSKRESLFELLECDQVSCSIYTLNYY